MKQMQDSNVQGYKLSPQQRRLWLLDLRRGNETQSRARALVKISGPVDVDALRRACELMAARHDALRTTLYRRAGMRLPLQVVKAAASVGWVEENGAVENGAGLAVRVTRINEDEHTVELSVPGLCADAASLRNVVNGLARCYEEVIGGTPSQDEVMQYPDYADWQNELLQAEDEEALAGNAFWRRRDVAQTSAVKLPYEVSTEGREEFVPQQISTQLDGSVVARLVSEAETKSWTVEGYLLTCWVVLLWHLCGREEIAVGERVNGRKYTELESAVGLFEKWLPVRVPVDGGASLRELIEQIETRRCEIRDWQDYYPCEPNSESDVPVSIGFSYEEEPDTGQVGSFRFTLLRYDAPTEEFKIQLNCLRRNDSLQVEIQYDASVLHRRHAERIKNQFEALLENALKNSEARVRDLSPLCEEERENLLRHFNRTEAPFPQDKAIHDLFEEQVARTPHRIAVVSGQTRMTYAELNAEANQLARFLRSKGVGEGVCVALSIERSAKAVVGMLGVLKSGGAYVPLNVDAPKERVMQQLSETQSTVLVLTEKGILRHTKPPYRGESTDDLKLLCVPDSLAYVIYTSGSTGVPKGVAVTHRNLVNYAHFICREFDLYEASADEGLHFATVSTIAADLGHTVVFPSLLTGGCLHILSNDVATDADLFARYVQEHPIDVLKIVPSHLNALLTTPEGTQVLPRRQLFLGGEAFTTDLLKTLTAMNPACEVINHYGPTEATVGALVNRLERGEAAAAATVPVGRPIANVEAYVLDESLHPVPAEVAGELYLGGEGVARGYLNQSAQTAERFVPHTYAKQPGARLYRTGDVVRHLPDGKIEFLGRADDQVKIHGYRVELGEIAVVLRQHPSVRDAVVILRDDAGPKRLVAYTVCAPGAVLTAAELHSHTADRLPDYMVPATYIFLDRLPLTPNGKIDRRALPTPAESHDAVKQKVPPRTDTERALAAIWKEVLHLEQVGIYDNFFELGGDSIQGIQIVAKARQVGLRLLPKQIFSAQTIADLAAVGRQNTVRSPVVTQEVVTGPVPLTPIQQWFFQQQLDNPHHFNQAVLLKVPSGIDATVLRRALSHLLEHHDALRMRFKYENDGRLQRYEEPGGETPFAEVDLSHVTENELGAAIEAEAEKWQHSLNLGDGPLVRMVLIRLSEEQDARLLIVAHHLIVDGVSWRILFEDLELAYEQISKAESVRLPDKTLSFKRWAERLTEYAQSEKLGAEAPYWLNVLDRGAGGALASDNPLGRNDRASARAVTVSLSAEETRALLKDVPKAYRTEIMDILLTALVRATWKWRRQRALLVDLEGHGREQFDEELDVSRTVGWFTTHYPVLLELAEVDETPAATLKRVKELLRAVPQRGLGFGLLKWMRGDQQLAEQLRQSSPNIRVNYLGQLDAALAKTSRFSHAAESSGATQDQSGQRSYLVDLDAAVMGGKLHLRWTFAPEVHLPASVEQLVEVYIKEMSGLIRHCSSADAKGFTPSDFPAAHLNQKDLDAFIATLSAENVEDIYQLSPMQEGLLFHGLLTPESDVYFRQLSCAIEGNLNVAAFCSAWQMVIDRHPALRTSFHRGGLKTPLQVANRSVSLPLEQLDWRGLSPEEQSTRLEALMHEESRRGFNLSQAPLMRMALIRLGDAAYHLVWSYHHLLMDGWAKHSVIQQFLECYRASCRESEISVSASRPYGDYIKWLQRQDMKKAEAHWRATLVGFDSPTPIVAQAATEGDERQALYNNRRILLSEETTAALHRLTRTNQLTLNTVVQGAWGIFLSHISRRSDVVFGAVVSGRPPDLEGSEKMIGLFVNTLPIRLQVEPDTEVIGWLKRLQEQEVEMQEYEYTPLVMVQNWSDLPRGAGLFESLLVFENYPTQSLEGPEQESSLWFSNFTIIEFSTFPLTLMVGPATQLSLLFLYDTRRFDVPVIDRMLDRLVTILTTLAGATTGTRLEEIQTVVDEADRQDQLVKEKELKEFHLQKLKSVKRKAVRAV